MYSNSVLPIDHLDYIKPITGTCLMTRRRKKNYSHYHEESPATPENPRIVSRELIYHFERGNPSRRGISRLMLKSGIWVLPDDLSLWDQTFPDPLTEDVYNTPHTLTREYLDDIALTDPLFKEYADDMIKKGIWVVKGEPESQEETDPEGSNE